MSEFPQTLPARVLRMLARAVCKHPKWFVWTQSILFVLSILYTVKFLEFSTSRNDLVGSDKKYHRNFLSYHKEFEGQDDMVAVVESEDAEKNRQFVERLGARLEAERDLFAEVFYKGDLKLLGPKALQLLDEATLKDLHKTLREYTPFIGQFTQATNLNALLRQVNRQFRSAKREASEENEAMVKALPALQRIIDQATASLQRPGMAPSPGLNALFNAGPEAEEQQYITFAKGRIYLVNVRTGKEQDNERGVERFRALVQETQNEVPGVNVGITGEPVLEFDEMRQSTQDSTVATIVSLVACALIFIYSYRSTGRPLKATLCLIFGLAYTMGYTTLVVGHLNILTVTFLPILIGLAIDFGVHLITRFEEELRLGQTPERAIEIAMVNTGLGIFTGCFTTAGAFFAMGLTDFKGIQEMGIITGGGMLICLVPMMTLLPIMLLRGRQNVLDQHPTKIDRRARVERWWLDRPWLVTGVTISLAAISVWLARNTWFDYNLLNMQTRDLPAVAFEHKLINSASKSVLFGAVVAKDAEHALRLQQQLTNLPSVASVDSMSQFLTGDRTNKLSLVGKVKTEIKDVRFSPTDNGPVKLLDLAQTLFALHGYLGLALVEVQKEKDAELATQLGSLRESVFDLRKAMAAADPERASERIGAYQRALFNDIHDTFTALRAQDNSSVLAPEDLPSALRNRFIGKTGKQLIQVYPKGNVWQHDEQKRFVEELRSVDPNVTGTPVQLLEYTELLKQSYLEAAGYALMAIIILVFLHFRNISCVVLSLLPVFVGTLWMLGYMGLTNTPFNPANIMTLPLVIGIGVTNGIHILNRFSEEQNPSILAKSTGKAVLVSALTTIAGFGSLIPAKHQGIASLGTVMSVGVATCMIAGLTFLPAILTILMRRGWKISSTGKKPDASMHNRHRAPEEPR